MISVGTRPHRKRLEFIISIHIIKAVRSVAETARVEKVLREWSSARARVFRFDEASPAGLPCWERVETNRWGRGQ